MCYLRISFVIIYYNLKVDKTARIFKFSEAECYVLERRVVGVENFYLNTILTNCMPSLFCGMSINNKGIQLVRIVWIKMFAYRCLGID